MRLYALGFVLLLARAAADRLSGDSIFLSLRSLHPVVLMSVSGVHSRHVVGGACLSKSLSGINRLYSSGDGHSVDCQGIQVVVL